MWTLQSLLILSVIQMQQEVLAAGCSIVSVTSPSASTLNVVWSAYDGASVYMLDLRVVNSTTVAPVVVMQTAPSTQRLVQGLRPGHRYELTLKVFEFHTVVCTDVQLTVTVPATSQITSSKALSSTTLSFEWSSVIGAETYTLFVEKLFSFPPVKYNQTFTTLSGRVDGLSPSTTYNCYVYSSNTAGRGARSNIKTIMTLVQPPTGVALVPTGKSTARVTWNSVSKVLLYQVSVSDNEQPSNAPVVRNTSATTMDIGGLEPCSTYTVGVSSVNVFLLPGEASNVTHTTSTINPVTTVSVDYSCTGGMVTVTWDLVFGANLYRATAVDGTGAALNCTSASTSCQIAELRCGENYNVHVTAISDDCESTSNVTALFETVPCAPANPHTIHDCSSNVIVFSWQPTNNTFYYVATAEDDTGKVTECRTPDNTCFFTNTGCGQFYTYSVYAVSSGCNSQVSQPQFVRTPPCLPTNIRTAPQCHSEMLITTWDSAAGALSYTVEAQGNTGETYNCTSSSNSCAVTGVPCGEHLSVWIVASNGNCTTDKVLGEVAQTVPCTPTDVVATVDCSQDSARMNWTTSIGAILYIAVAQDSDGNSYSCNSMGTSCLLDHLRCGHNYTANVIGSNLKCNSTASRHVSFRTAPCPPTDIEAHRDCDANHALVTWQNHQPTGRYSATIEDQHGARLNCTSDTVNSCKIPAMPCGKRYGVTVTYHDGNCPSTSAAVSMDSVPCGPEDVHASVTCVTGELTVTWNISVPADRYTTIISSGPGQPLRCNSTGTQCVSAGLPCGSSYTLAVFSVTGSCLSLPSAEVTVQTLPCPPTNIAALHACSPDPTPVSWVASSSASHYTAVAESSTGHTSECTTNQTSCSLSGLRCGDVYTVAVAGVDHTCTGPPSDPVSLHTEPCVPSDVSSQVNCSAGTAQVSWAADPNAADYAVEATGAGETLTCQSSSPNCTLTSLVCGHAYDVVVTASDGICVSNYSAPFRQHPVPCAPLNISTSTSCGSGDLTVSWNNVSEPLNYSVSAVPGDAAVASVSCHTAGAGCILGGLVCGQTYTVSVNAHSGSCRSADGAPQTVHTAPCAPHSVVAVPDCGTNSLHVSWNASSPADSYTANITGPDSFSHTCSSSGLTCSFGGLRCGTQYSIAVTSVDGPCTSPPTRVTATTGPCDPVGVTSALQCGSDEATVSWDASVGAVAYTVLAAGSGSQQHASCRTSSTSCQLSQLTCGTVYNLTVQAEGVVCNSSAGTGTTLMTAPCSPSIHSSSLICGTQSSSLSWGPVADAIGYTVNASAAHGHAASCTSATAACRLADLQCGETYSATVTARGAQCDSAPGPSVDITTAPCPPAIVSKQFTCGTNTAVLNWTGSAGHLGFLAQISGEGFLGSCRTVNSSCAIDNLPCGLDLNVTVQAEGAQCNSPPGVSELLQTAPCPPENVSAIPLCSNRSALVSWVGSAGAVGYNVMATGRNGRSHHCHTNTTECHLSDIPCGEIYGITVTPYSESCPGNPSAVSSFRSDLCPPGNVTVSAACENHTVSWSSVTGAEMYVATAGAADGHNQTCNSNGSTSCVFSDLQCGGGYSVTVRTVDRGCRSEPSAAVQVLTAPCPPTDLGGQVNCDTQAVTLTWDQSPTANTTYILQSESLGSGLRPSYHPTPNTSLALTHLPCGHRYAFRVAAHEGRCIRYSAPMDMTTAPCPPTGFSAHVDCGTNRGNFSWEGGAGADRYTVEVTGEHGHVASCSTADTSCAVTLHCGRVYVASLVASSGSCNSSKHADIRFDSAPCLPADVLSVVDCQTNVMNVSWTRTAGSDHYTAWAIGADGHRASCNSSSSSCSIGGLRCGRVYEVAVTSSSVHCEVIAGSDYKVQSAPCRPENTSVGLNCSSNVLTVMWNQSGTSHNYTVAATSESGVTSTCRAADSSCSFVDLSCGHMYSLTVTGHSDVCMSEMSRPLEKLTAPCPPSDLSATMNCTTLEALVSWSTAAAASAYSVQATSASGHVSTCSGTGTSCPLSDLVCGQEYSVAVEAVHPGCPGPASVPVWLTTEPCPPGGLSVHYNVSDAQIRWAAASGAASYSVQAATDQGLTAGCTSGGTGCPLTGLQCGQTYNVTVTAHNPTCDSLLSETTQIRTEPCPPTKVQAHVACEHDSTATASWELSDLAVGYVAYFSDRMGRGPSCVGADADSSCVVSGLVCGTEYEVWVKALGDHHNSSDSRRTSVRSGPCPPSSIEAQIDCETQSAIVSWQPARGAASYVAQIHMSSGHAHRCSTSHTNCRLSALQCGEEHDVSVESVGDTCNSTGRMAGHLATEPCVPGNVTVLFNVSHALVLWGPSRGARSYSVRAQTDRGLTAACTTSGSDCAVTGLQCGQIYNVTVTAHNLACNHTHTARAEARPLRTEPCPPNNVQAHVACEHDSTATASWELSDLAVGYIAYFADRMGRGPSCVGADADSSCVVSGLVCGTEYEVWVKALGEHHNSSDSRRTSVRSGPCLPSALEVGVDCSSDGTAVVSWDAAPGAANFSLTASASPTPLCATQQSSCNVTGLTCGRTYSLSLTAATPQCSLTAPLQTNLTTRPCPPRRVAADMQCGSHTAVVSWEGRSDVDGYTARAVGLTGGEVKDCSSAGSSCQFSNLTCGETYNFTVTAQSHGCSSPPSPSVSLQTVPCQPVVASARTTCHSEEAQVSWQDASGVETYVVTATGSLGFVELYTTNLTVLSAPLPCGQNYTVTVQGRGSRCDSAPSRPSFLHTAPCVPRDVTTYVQCELSVGSVSWGASDGAQWYVAVATGPDGHTHRCVTNSTSCTWDDLHCGGRYSVVVSARDETCASPPSNSTLIHTDPCLSRDLVGSVDCNLKVVSLSWDGGNGTDSFVVLAEGGNHSVSVSTNVPAAHFSDFTCGQTYSLTVTPHSHHCPGAPSPPASVLTWPCPPGGVSTMQDCLSGIVMVTWQASNGTDDYTATMQTDAGTSQICMSDSDKCSVPGLTCGQNFSVSVTASNQQCNITSSVGSRLTSVPCAPSNVSVETDCTKNNAAVSWSASRGAVWYSVTAHSLHSNISCQTSDLTCRLDDLLCGSLYTVQVMAMDDLCSSVPSPSRSFHSAPCPPQNVSAQISCASNDLTISWDAAREAEYFLVSVSEDGGGGGESCNTTGASCSISNLTCGNRFRVHVTSVRGGCHSQRSPTPSVTSAPCQPQGVSGSLDCVTNSAWISWDAAAGADSYTVSAMGGGEYVANCTAGANTTCEVEDLACGVLFNFTVTATNRECDSRPSAAIDLQTAPCSLSAITALPQCHNSSILVVWALMEASEGNSVYTATAEASDHTFLTCNSTGSSCFLHGARCDLRYTVIVSASSDRCSSLRSPPYRISMEPCPPTDVTLGASCGDRGVLVSWTASPVADSYRVVAAASDGLVHTCSSPSTNCSLAELRCEQLYTVSVTASHQNCSSRSSHTASVQTGPCQPEGLSVTFHCANRSAVLSWTPGDSAIAYYGRAQGDNGDTLHCNSPQPPCVIETLDCGSLYNFSVQASDGTCSSPLSEALQSGAVPCPPQAVEVDLLPMRSEIQVLSFMWTEIACRDTEYLLRLRGGLLGDSQAQFELSSYWTNRTSYEIPLPCGSSFVATVESRNRAGTSDPSAPLTGTTAPCPPSGAVSSGNSTFTSVSWDPAVFATTYTVYDSHVAPGSALCTTAALSCSLANMAPTNLVITASNAAGESEGTNVTTVEKRGRRRRELSERPPQHGGPPAPALNVTQPVPTVVLVEWTPVEAASRYSLVLKQQGGAGSSQELTVYGERMILTDLTPGSTYCVSVTAWDHNSSGPQSEPVCVQTGRPQ